MRKKVAEWIKYQIFSVAMFFAAKSFAYCQEYVVSGKERMRILGAACMNIFWNMFMLSFKMHFLWPSALEKKGETDEKEKEEAEKSLKDDTQGKLVEQRDLL